MILETPRLILRPVNIDDAEDIYEYAHDLRVGPDAGWVPHNDIDETKSVIIHNLCNPESGIVLALELKSSGKMIGSVGLHPEIHRNNPYARMLGYVLNADYWGNGYVPEAARALIDYGFKEMDLDLISCLCYDYNQRSRRVIEKLGFTLEGTIHEAEFRYDGRLLNHECYYLKNPYK